MDNASDNLVKNSVQQRKKTSEKTKTKKNQPMKVVYISNPMKYNIIASEFRNLVQQLTGQYSELPVDPPTFVNHVGGGDHGGGGGGNHMVADHSSSKTEDDEDDEDEEADNDDVEVPTVLDLSHEQLQQPKERPDYEDEGPLLLDSSSSFDDYFMPPMFDNFSPIDA